MTWNPRRGSTVRAVGLDERLVEEQRGVRGLAGQAAAEQVDERRAVYE